MISKKEVIDIREAAEEATQEVFRARETFPVFNSHHEGIAVIREEFDELWTEVKKRDQDKDAMRKEAKHLAAMALRFMVDLT